MNITTMNTVKTYSKPSTVLLTDATLKTGLMKITNMTTGSMKSSLMVKKKTAIPI